ncbi:carbohydrate ABC transporter permease [Sporolactobacillus shoreicorticis]|uniref:Carbohydrate ABC transporter permease n=1 Tax=Sporolactobacillus shoreicorticis TaxID=1923877 RepID=A0ABW5S8M7_9BACL|nr:carbohydrate ABC transporter permease [Sporolactobacillus shoreicorticis]MCO7125540.1 carbohydrate ABC transporter permease [Sporolactobacillus shoreicorticis]
MRRGAFSKGFIYLLLIAGGILMLLPFVWMISTSLKAPNQVMTLPPIWLPHPIEWSNYLHAWHTAPFARYLFNSIFVAALSTLGVLLTTILAAYAFSQINFYGRDVVFSILLGTMMVPGEILLIPNFVTLVKLGWIDHYEALTVPWMASVFAIFLLRQFFLSIPKELSYAAKMDGCSDFKYLWLIMVPISKPALITIALLQVIGSWNSFLWPLIVTNSMTMRTMPVGLMAFSSEAGTEYNLLMVAATMVILPMIILFIILQKYIIEGVTRAGIKG